jgi:hypothetical protein
MPVDSVDNFSPAVSDVKLFAVGVFNHAIFFKATTLLRIHGIALQRAGML